MLRGLLEQSRAICDDMKHFARNIVKLITLNLESRCVVSKRERERERYSDQVKTLGFWESGEKGLYLTPEGSLPILSLHRTLQGDC